MTELKKKSPVEERLAYADEVMEDILDSANFPLTGNRWWMQAEDPWQTLAACIEIKNALNHPDGPENYVSRLPIHQDGSCNGLQHYAALGRDKLGATYVNVVPGGAPQVRILKYFLLIWIFSSFNNAFFCTFCIGISIIMVNFVSLSSF